MAKLNNIFYGKENEEKLNEIINVLTIQKTKWESINPTHFDLTDKDATKLDGSHYKNFYLCNSNSIPNLAESTFSKTNNYVTYFSNISNEGLVPEKISVLIKCENSIKEVLASQILNYFGCNTAFNFFIKTKNAKENYLGSIDFISENEQFETFKNLNIIWTYDLNGILAQINDKNTFPNISHQNRKNLKKEIIKSFLTRICVLDDFDFDNYNCGILLNKKTNYVKFINFDYELSLAGNSQEKYINEVMLTAFTDFPSIYREFISKTTEIYNVLNEVNLYIEDKNYNNIITNLKENLVYILKKHNELILETNNINNL